jgi:hypothetical protein
LKNPYLPRVAHWQAAEKGLPQPAPSLLSLPEEEKIKKGSQFLCRVPKASRISIRFNLDLSAPRYGQRQAAVGFEKTRLMNDKEILQAAVLPQRGVFAG